MTSRPLTGREYLEQLRARRATARAGEPAANPVSDTPVLAPPVMEQPTVTEEVPPVATSMPDPAPKPIPEPISTPTPEPDDTDLATSPIPYIPGMEKPEPEETIMEWIAPSRPFKPRSRQYYVTIAILVALISLILFFAGQMIPIAVVFSVGFLAYILASVPPDMVRIRLTTYGVRFEKQIYYWDQLGRFWMDEKYGQKLVNIETFQFPYRLTLLLGENPPEDLEDLLREVLFAQKPDPTILERAAEWLQKHIPLELE